MQQIEITGVTGTGPYQVEVCDITNTTCVVCGKKTPYLKSTNIYQRYGYVEGAGQACPHPDNCD